MILGGPVAKKGAGVISETAEQIAKKGEDLIGPTVAGFKETEAIQTLSKVPEKIQEIPGQIKEIPGKIKRKIIPEGKGREIAIRDMNELSEIKGKQLADFKRFSGDKTPGEFLVERGIVGKQDEIAQGLAKNFQTVKTALDDAVGQVRGNFSSPKLINALKQLQKETNEFSPELASITNRLARATQKDLVSGKPVGISLTEALETARQIERQAALFKAGNLPKAAQRMKDVKDALRQFIFEQAEAGGFTNITELSKEIQLHKNLLNAVGKRLDAKAFKPELDFTENMLLVAGTIEPSALAGLAVKKIARSERFKAARAKFLSPKAIKELPQPPTELINIRNREKMLDDLNSFLRRHGFTMKKERLDRMLPDSGVIQAKGPNVIAKEFQEDLQKFLLKEPTDPSIIPIELPAPSK